MSDLSGISGLLGCASVYHWCSVSLKVSSVGLVSTHKNEGRKAASGGWGCDLLVGEG